MIDDPTVLLAVAAVMAVGVVGVLLPFVPGLPLIWGAALVYGLDDGFSMREWLWMTPITVLLVVGAGAKLVLPHRRASATGAPRSTLILGAIGGVIGFFVIPVIGLPLGAVLAVLAAEHRRTRDWGRAWVSTKSAIVGFGIGVLVELAAGLAMVAVWLAWALTTAEL